MPEGVIVERIFKFEYENNLLDLAILNDVPNYRNIYSIIVGKNGVGKSRLLSELAKKNSRVFSKNTNSINIDNSEYIPKIIAVSTSPFDKFPSNRRSSIPHNLDSNYRYVGMRGEGLFGVSSAVSLLSSATKGWLEKLVTLENTANLLDVFNSLNFEPYAEFVFKPGYIGKANRDYNYENRAFFDNNFIDHEFFKEIDLLYEKNNISIDKRYLRQLSSYNIEHRQEIYEAMIEIHSFEASRKAVTLEVDFSSREFYTDSHYERGHLSKAILTLLSAGLMRLMDVRLLKNNFGPMSLKRASSGEQCLLVIMLGIAGHITDNSIILIDEPEISLHPRWQEEFMIMLTNTFSSYQGCQFIIATHSPQIISRLNVEGCYITSLSDGAIYKASYFSNRSADYQLAELFDAPGMMNEYIARLAFSLLAKVKSTRKVTFKNKKDLKQLENLAKNIDREDPTLQLVASVVEVCEIYANDK